MGKLDEVQKVYWEDNRRFADLFNTVLGEGEYLILPEDIDEENVNLPGVKQECEKRYSSGRIRDVIRKVTKNMTCFLVGIENQNHVHYAMPARVMMWDALGYEKQLRQIKRDHEEKKDLDESDEFLSRIKNGEYLKPICTIVLYYGEKEWDGPKNLHELLDMKHIPERIRWIFADYPMVLVDVARFPDWEKFETDLREVFGFIRNAGNGEAMKRFLEENQERLSVMPEDACDFLETVTETKELKRFRKKKDSKEEGRMCTAIREMMEESRKEGRKEGMQLFEKLIERLMAENRLEDISRVVKDQVYRDKLMEELS